MFEIIQLGCAYLVCGAVFATVLSRFDKGVKTEGDYSLIALFWPLWMMLLIPALLIMGFGKLVKRLADEMNGRGE